MQNYFKVLHNGLLNNKPVPLFLLPWHVWTGVCVKMSQNLTVVSPEPLARWRPSGLKLTDITASAWPGKELKLTFIISSALTVMSYNHIPLTCLAEQ